MLVIRLQRTGRKGHAQFRVVVQDSRRTPTSGKIVAQLGTYDPHAKTITLDKERAQHYLNNGAQPSDRVIFVFEKEGIKLPTWVKKAESGKILQLLTQNFAAFGHCSIRNSSNRAAISCRLPLVYPC